MPEAAQEIWTEYLSGDSLNIDSQSRELSRKNMAAPDRWAFDIAAVCNRTFSLCKIRVLFKTRLTENSPFKLVKN